VTTSPTLVFCETAACAFRVRPGPLVCEAYEGCLESHKLPWDTNRSSRSFGPITAESVSLFHRRVRSQRLLGGRSLWRGRLTTVEDVIVHLASPKCGRLLITVIDAQTNKKIRDAQVSLNHEGNPKTLLISGTNRPDDSFNLLVPPDVVVDLKVTAPGYRDWHYNTDRSKRESKPLRVAPDTTKELNVTLRPRR